MIIVVIKNTYPEYDNFAHAKQGDVAKWEVSKNCYRLVRVSDRKVIFSTPQVDKDGLLLSTKKRPILIGVIAEVKSKNWILEIGKFNY